MPGMQEAVDRGLFREDRAADAQPHMGAILATAQEIASGMAFLHKHSIVHGDLAGGTPRQLHQCAWPDGPTRTRSSHRPKLLVCPASAKTFQDKLCFSLLSKQH